MVARDATTSVHGGTEKLAAKITERLEKACFEMLSVFFPAQSIYKLGHSLYIDVVNPVDHPQKSELMLLRALCLACARN